MRPQYRVVVIGGALAAVAAGIGVYRWMQTRADPFGTLEQVRRAVPPSMAAWHGGKADPAEALNDEAVLRSMAARPNFRGRAGELEWFLHTLEGTSIPAAEGYLQSSDPWLPTVMLCLCTIAEGWDAAGPYPGVRDRVEEQALRYSGHPVTAARAWSGAVLSLLERTGSLGEAGRARLEALAQEEVVGEGIRTLLEYRLIRHRERGGARR